MTWGRASHAVSPDALGSEGMTAAPQTEAPHTSGPAMSTERTVKPGTLCPLILSPIMQREALAADHAKAVKRRDMRAVNRIEAELRNAVNRILGRGACFETRGEG
ncbi:MAG: hypothetical protein HC889_16915 [Synechococcaceae cyanobacterium SM1_2_3]|nr:hypothetical protein [Synechococcaceae cyanobacterium SM1_2_3]